MEIATLTASGLSRSAFLDSPFKALSLEVMVLFLYPSFFRWKAWSKMDWVVPLEPGVGVEPTFTNPLISDSRFELSSRGGILIGRDIESSHPFSHSHRRFLRSHVRI